MEIILTSVGPELAEAWQRFCGDLPDVKIYQGSITDLKCDAVVSPANSFGFMDGGIDMIYSEHFGWHVQERLQTLIREKHHGELLVGSAEIVDTDDPNIPYLIAAPTMRVPMILKNSVNPYLAARAVFLLIKYGVMAAGKNAGKPVSELVKTVAFPGLGTGAGRVGPNTCANQVRQAILEIVMEQGVFPASWVEVQTQHQKLYTDRIRDLQYE